MKKYLKLLIASFAILLTFAGCGNIASGGAESGSKAQAASQISSQAQSSKASSQASSQAASQEPSSKKTAPLDEHGTYDSAQDVADYLLYYHKLPENYMTKNEARKMGWEGGALNQVVPGKCIGGDVFSNLEGALPENATYHECDIDTINSKTRGSKRIVWSEDFKIYYTKDHYENFELIAEEK